MKPCQLPSNAPSAGFAQLLIENSSSPPLKGVLTVIAALLLNAYAPFSVPKRSTVSVAPTTTPWLVPVVSSAFPRKRYVATSAPRTGLKPAAAQLHPRC